jgi:NADH-quinone oxidoreductase subunit L
MTFSGTFRGTPEQEHHLHESPTSMVLPLQVLAAGAIFAGFLGIPHAIDVFHIGNGIESFLHPVFADAHHALEGVFTAETPGIGVELILMAASIALAAGGIFVATRLYKARPEIPKRLAESWPTAYRWLLNKYYVDELYGKIFVRGAALGGGDTLHKMDRYVVDGGDGEVRPGLGVNGVAWGTRDVVAWFSNVWDKYVVDGLVNLTAAIFDNVSYVFRAVQNGLVQHYALAMLIAVLFLIGASRLIQ